MVDWHGGALALILAAGLAGPARAPADGAMRAATEDERHL